MASESNPSAVRRAVNDLIKSTFNVPLKGIEYQPFKFTIKTVGFEDLGYDSKMFLEFKSEQSFWNECYCRGMENECKILKERLASIAKENGVIASGGMHHAPARLEKDGDLDCKQWLVKHAR